MKKIAIAALLILVSTYPPTLSKGEPVQETELHYLMIKNDLLKYQIKQKVYMFRKLYKSLK